MKKFKNGCHFINIDCMEKFQITNPPKVWVSGFPSVNGNGISALAIKRKLKNGCHFVNIYCMEKFQITNPPKVWVSGFLSVDGNGISASAIMKKLKMAASSLISIIWNNFKLLTPPKFGSPVFQVSTETEYHWKTRDTNFLFSEFSIGSFFPITLPRFHFNI